MKKEIKDIEFVEQAVFCNLTGYLCRHCSEESSEGMGSFCDLKTQTLFKNRARQKIGQMCNCESVWVSTLSHCPLEDCIKPTDYWSVVVEKKQKPGQQELL